VLIRITRSARKHRIGNAHILAALASASEPIIDGDARTYIATDDRGLELAIVIVPDDRNEGSWAIIHAQPTHYPRKGQRDGED